MKNLFPIVLFVGGALVALAYACVSIAETSNDYVIEFAVASLVAVIGWCELRAEQGGEGING